MSLQLSLNEYGGRGIFRTPTGFHHLAQGWPAARDYPGSLPNDSPTLKVVAQIF